MSHNALTPLCSRANEGSILAVQVFDQKKFKKKDQGFLGVINIRVGDLMPDISADADGTLLTHCHFSRSRPPCLCLTCDTQTR